ncbi:hypothetical protein ACFLZ6_01405, partial [Nanoarchaeota archaeon]
VDRKVDYSVEKIKRRMMRSVLQALFLGLSIVLMLAGSAVFLSRFFPPELIILGEGVFCLYVYIIISLIK